ncbi:MAG TPA: isopentenyl-diphosphate delta-isomerase [Flavobacteriales bacterium]|jgi:isopentenyl-diphosphate delta-isomerase|nr:isopentenyl-diphosphate delta-isomerase [Flavobacteriales bacterium]
MEEQVILVDQKDEMQGLMGKTEAHEKGVLHRAFSVFLFNKNRELLLQKRASSKYHSANLWANTCCSHPRENESVLEAAHRRLMEEMGISSTLNEEFSFIYKAELDNGMIEHELDHVLFGKYDGEPIVNTNEVQDWKYMDIPSLEKDIENHPDRYAPWLRIALSRVHQIIHSTS